MYCSTIPESIPEMPSKTSGMSESSHTFEVLVFSKTAGFRHSSIPTAIDALKAMAQSHNFLLNATEDADAFTFDNLVQYEAVVFLNTSLDVLNERQQAAFKRYIQQGGGYVGVHAAADTEYDWEWYGGLVGAYFKSHPAVQVAEVQFVDRQDAFASGLPSRWKHNDEWYNYNLNPRENVHVVAVVKEASYEGGEMGHDHPIAWAHMYDGGRSFYTGMGHTTESYSSPFFLSHLYNGLRWAAGQVDADVTATLAKSYEKVVLTSEITNPMELDVANDGRVFVVEWSGSIKIWEPDTHQMRVVGWVPVDKSIEDGLLGIALDPAFDENGWMYIYYSPIQEGNTSNRLSRFTYDGHWVDLESEVVVLEVPNQRVRCCHSAGSLQFDSHGNLFLSTGDNSGGDRDHTDLMYRRIADQGRTAANTNDLRGKILRITPRADGSYSIPEGNLFAADSLHRGEIYTMGHRNPFRYSIDEKTGWIYWGDVGPGSAGGFDEFNRAKEPGFFGWPLFTGYNDPFTGYYFHGADDMETYMNPDKPFNASPYNTGAQELPPAQPAMIPYLYGMSEEFPELGAGGMNPMAGPVFHYDSKTADERAIPPYYNDKLLIYEWMRHWLKVVTFDENGEMLKIDPFLPGIDFVRPIDIEVGPNGRLYVLEWGDEFWGSNRNAQLVRLDYNIDYSLSEKQSPTQQVDNAPFEVHWPPDGGTFDIGEPIPFKISMYDEALSDQLKINTYTGFDTSPFPLNEVSGLEGHFVIDSSFTPTPNVNYADRFGVFEACLSDQRKEDWCSRFRLNPKFKEAEHVASSSNARRITYSTHPASQYWGATALTVMKGGAGMRLEYAPFNLINIDSVTLRFRAESQIEIAMHLEGDEFVPVASVSLSPESGDEITPRQYQNIKDLPQDTRGIPEVIERGYLGWREVTAPIATSSTTGTLVIEISSESDGGDVELDWVRFSGSGVSVMP